MIRGAARRYRAEFPGRLQFSAVRPERLERLEPCLAAQGTQEAQGGTGTAGTQEAQGGGPSSENYHLSGALSAQEALPAGFDAGRSTHAAGQRKHADGGQAEGDRGPSSEGAKGENCCYDAQPTIPPRNLHAPRAANLPGDRQPGTRPDRPRPAPPLGAFTGKRRGSSSSPQRPTPQMARGEVKLRAPLRCEFSVLGPTTGATGVQAGTGTTGATGVTGASWTGVRNARSAGRPSQSGRVARVFSNGLLRGAARFLLLPLALVACTPRSSSTIRTAPIQPAYNTVALCAAVLDAPAEVSPLLLDLYPECRGR